MFVVFLPFHACCRSHVEHSTYSGNSIAGAKRYRHYGNGQSDRTGSLYRMLLWLKRFSCTKQRAYAQI
jgi:hypothetical protein